MGDISLSDPLIFVRNSYLNWEQLNCFKFLELGLETKPCDIAAITVNCAEIAAYFRTEL